MSLGRARAAVRGLPRDREDREDRYKELKHPAARWVSILPLKSLGGEQVPVAAGAPNPCVECALTVSVLAPAVRVGDAAAGQRRAGVRGLGQPDQLLPARALCQASLRLGLLPVT